MNMVDVQSQVIQNGRTIDRVGVTNLSYPIVVMDRKFGEQHTVAKIKMFVQLPEHFRGTHMSRFLEVMNRMGRTRITPHKIKDILLSIKTVMKAKTAHLELDFPYFIDREAPVSKSEGLSQYRCVFEGTHDENDQVHFFLEVHVTVMNVCPCSRELSPGKSAHNQRSKVSVRIKCNRLVWIEEIVDLVETSASSPVYTILKRSDEKAVMDRAHDRPRFVEDIVREIASRLDTIEGIHYYRVESENLESIHHHNVYACIERDHII